jgi:hypothetical protein
MLTNSEVEQSREYWILLQQEAAKPGRKALRRRLLRVGNDPSPQAILELYAEYVYGVRKLKRRGPMVCTGGRKPGNDKRR